MKNTLKWAKSNHQQSSAIISFFFNARGGPLERTSVGMFRSLLHQLFQQRRHLFSSFLPKYRTKRDTLPPNWDWQEGELREYFSDIITNANVSSIIIFIDALDECEAEEIRSVVTFFAKLTSSAASSNCSLNVCLSSRHHPNISVPGCVEVYMENGNALDITKYVESQLCLESEQGTDFRQEIVSKASGVFLWVVLVVEKLHQKQDDGGSILQMRRILESTPEELGELFTKYFNTVVDFWMNWVIEPVKKLIGTIRHDENSEVAIMSKHSLEADRDSLERMVVEFAVDNPIEGSKGSLSEADIASIRSKVKEGDLTPVLKAYERDLRSPFMGSVRGDLIRALLIQIQKTKVDVEVAIGGIDALLKSQELVFGYVQTASAYFP